MNPLRKKLYGKNIILGSSSPRRKELLASLNIPFKIEKIPIDETYPKDLKKEDIAAYISVKKAKSFQSLDANEILITADTIVCTEDHVFGKPNNAEAAKNMLKSLSGKEHIVYTAFTIKSRKKIKSRTSSTKIFFKNLSEEEINYYIEHSNPIDKAGAYGIQEWIGQIGIKCIEGNFYSVMGLPLNILYEELIIF